MTDRMSERDDITLRVAALIEGTTLAEQRRTALAAWAAQARTDPHIAQVVRLVLAHRRTAQGNVISLGGRRG